MTTRINKMSASKLPDLGKIKLHRFKDRMWATFDSKGRILVDHGVCLYRDGFPPPNDDELSAEVEVIIRPISKGEREFEGREY